MLHLVYSSRTELLLDALVSDIREHRERLGPLEPVHLVLPNRNVEAYLRFGVARALGIAANLEVHFLRRFVTGLLGRGRTPVRLVDADVLRGLLLGLLLDGAVLRRPELAPVHRYLHAVGEAPDAVDLRRFQLADQLALLFEEYSYSRDTLLAEWPRRPVLGDTPFAETEAWQRALWLELCGPEGVLARRTAETGVPWVHLGGACEVLRGGELSLPPRLHVFGLSFVARAFQRILGLLAERTELRVYALNPCREFWEDVETEREQVRRRARRPRRLGLEALAGEDPFSLAREGDTPALRLWGRPGRESIRLLNELAECDFQEAFPEALPAAPSLLQRLQQDILTRAPQPEAPANLPADGSIRVLACPGIRREAEAVAESIWALLQEDGTRARAAGEPPLRFNDIAVLVAGRDKEAYFSHLAAAFRACHDIPHNVVDLPFTAVSRMAEAVGLLLAFPLGGFSRPEVLRVLAHPAALARFPGADADRWVEWCERLGIVHGADRSDHAGTYIERDVLNWDQGMRRLALGAFMAGERGEGAHPLRLGEDVYLPEEVDRSSQPHAVHLAMAVRSLLADARYARTARLPLPEWARFMAALVEAHLAGANEFEARELERCLTAVRAVAEVDVGGRAVSYRIAHELAAQALAALPGARGQHLADGVVVSGLRPMRAIPFRAVFVVGLGEGEFPAADRRNPLDLRLARPQAGDVSAREQDRYAFLETLLCTRDRLTLSYVHRDALTGEALEPSPVVHELLGMLERGYVGREGRRALVRTVPRHRHALEEGPAPVADAPAPEAPVPAVNPLRDLPLFQTAFARATRAPPPPRVLLPEALREAAVVKLRESLRSVLGEGPLPDLATLRRALRPELRARLDARLGLCEPPSGREGPAREGPVRLSLSALRRFLECPMQGHAAYLLGLEEVEEDDTREREDELFATPFLDALQRLRRAFLEALGAGEERAQRHFEAAYDRVTEALLHSGHAPLGVFGEVERLSHVGLLETWGGLLRATPAARAQLRSRRFGGAEEGEVVNHCHPPLVLEVPVGAEVVRVELHGRLEALTEEPTGSLVLESRNLQQPTWKEAARRYRSALRGWLSHVVLTAAGVAAGSAHQERVLIAGKAPRALCYTFAPLTAEAARAYLTTLAADLLSGAHPYLLPCEAVFHAYGADGTGDIEASLARVLGEDKYRHSSRTGPVDRITAFRPPAPAEAEALCRRRFGPFWAHVSPVVVEG